jgi:hypothetical protein
MYLSVNFLTLRIFSVVSGSGDNQNSLRVEKLDFLANRVIPIRINRRRAET